MTVVDRVLQDAQILWDFHHVGHTLPDPVFPPQAIIHLGNNTQKGTAKRAADICALYDYRVPLICSGAKGHLTEDMVGTEADEAAEIAAEHGVPTSKIYRDPEATNTGANVANSRRICEELGLDVATVVAVQKPFMERRILGTFERQWPEVHAFVTSPQVKFEVYPTQEFPLRAVICTMVTDFMKVWEHRPKAMGFISKQEIPAEVWQAYGRLLAEGYLDDIEHMA